MAIVTIKEGIMMMQGVEKRAVHFDFRSKQASRLKILWATRRHHPCSFDWNYIGRRSTGSLWRGARLEAISPIG